MPIKINGTNTAANPSITGSDTDTGIVYGNDQIDFSIGGSSKLTLDSSGRVGIGITSPNVSGFNSDANVLTLSGPKRGFIELRGNTQAADSIGGIRFFSANNLEAEILSVTDSSYNGDLRFNTNGSERIRLLSSGGMTFNGDTATANALDDYEEGTWTASLNYGNHITTNAAYYTKIGQMVFWHLHFRFTFAPNDTAVSQIYGLPFTSKNVHENYGWTGNIVYSATANNSNIANMRPLVQKNDTYIYFHTVGLGNATRVLNNLIRSTIIGQDMLMGGFYMAA